MKPLILAQISDLHIKGEGELTCGVVDAARMLRACLAQILTTPWRPDFVLLTGDLVDGGAAKEYVCLRKLLAAMPMPVYLIPGNHDQRDTLREAFPDHAWLRQWPPFVQYAIDQWPQRVIALDTVVPGDDGGHLCEERLAWLDRTLAAQPEKPTLVMMHHPPFRTWITGMDRHGLLQPEAFAKVMAKHPQVERIICGHLHRHIEARLGRVPVSVCPSPAHQIRLDLATESRASFVMEPPGFLLHLWSAPDGMVTHYVPVGQFAGPYGFD
ncbi:MAG: phosphodiesterase [Burkholderiales bacterium]